MGRSFPSGRNFRSRRIRVWRGRRRYLAHYREEGSRHSKRTSGSFQRRFFTVRQTHDGDVSKSYVLADCQGDDEDATESAVLLPRGAGLVPVETPHDAWDGRR